MTNTTTDTIDAAHVDALAALDAAERYGVDLGDLTTGRALVDELGPTTHVYADRTESRQWVTVDGEHVPVLSWEPDPREPGDVGSLGSLAFVDVTPFVYAGNDGNDPTATSEATHVELPCVAWGDYAGDTYTRSNQRVLLANYPETFVELRGSHDYATLVLPLDAWIPTDLVATLVWLAHDYPVLDEEDEYELRRELEDESWESFGRDDLRREIVAELDRLDPDDTVGDHDDVLDTLDDGELDRLWWDYRSDGNGEETFCEDAVSACFRTAPLAARIARVELAELPRVALDN